MDVAKIVKKDEFMAFHATIIIFCKPLANSILGSQTPIK
jgi:hypothetical protein